MAGERTIELVLNIKIRIAPWLERPMMFFVLLYRRLRYGYAFRRIPLTRGKYAIVDADDYYRLAKHKWHARTSGKGKSFRAVRLIRPRPYAKQKVIWMHREIAGVPDNMFVDHINRNPLDNRKANLRPATHTQNARNSGKKGKSSRSKYKGVFWRKDTKKWSVKIGANRRTIHLGCFDNEIDAAKAYDEAAKKYHKEFAALNFPASPSR